MGTLIEADFSPLFSKKKRERERDVFRCGKRNSTLHIVESTWALSWKCVFFRQGKGIPSSEHVEYLLHQLVPSSKKNQCSCQNQVSAPCLSDCSLGTVTAMDEKALVHTVIQNSLEKKDAEEKSICFLSLESLENVRFGRACEMIALPNICFTMSSKLVHICV